MAWDKNKGKSDWKNKGGKGNWKGNDVTVSTSILTLTRFKDEPSKNRLFRIDGLNYGIYCAIYAQDDDKSFKNRLGGIFISKEDFGAVSFMFTKASEAMAAKKTGEFKVENKKSIIGVKIENFSDKLIPHIYIEDKETKKAGNMYLTIKPAVSQDNGDTIVDAEITLAVLGMIFQSIAIGTNTIWDGHINRLHAATHKEKGAGTDSEKSSGDYEDDDGMPY